MPQAIWREEFDIGIAEIDEQHRRICSLVGVLAESLNSDDDLEIAANLIAELIARCKAHFALEEQLMSERGYPDFESHKAEHDELLAKFLEVRNLILAGKRPKFSVPIEPENDWVSHHILRLDAAFATFLRESI